MISEQNTNLEPRKYDVTELREIISRQQALGRRFWWLLIVPFVVTTALLISVFLLFNFNARLLDVELLTKQLNIERYLLEDRNYSLAIDQYERIAKVSPTAPILARLGILYFQRDKTKEDAAVQILEKAKALDPNYWEIYRNLSYIYTVTRRSDKAVDAATTALNLNPSDAMSLNNLAWTLSQSDGSRPPNLEMAQKYAQQALALTADGEKKAEVLDTIAEIYYKRSDIDTALNYLRMAIANAPGWARERYEQHLERMQKDAASGGGQSK